MLHRAGYCFLITNSVVSSLICYPHCLSYYNEVSGGPHAGSTHLDRSNVDWGQDLIYLADWIERHPDAIPLRVVHHSMVKPGYYGANRGSNNYTYDPGDSASGNLFAFSAGWYAISVQRLLDQDSNYQRFRHRMPEATIGYSIRLYRLDYPLPRNY